MLRCLYWAVPLMLAAAPALAQEARVTAGITSGTLGTGPQLEVRLNETVGVRADAAFLRSDFIDVEADSDDIAFDGPVRMRSGGAMVDLYPLGGGFRLSAGLRISAMRAKLKATPTTNVTIGARTVTPIQVGTLSADYRLRDWAPAATIGFAGKLARRLVASVDAGILFHGAPHIRNLRSEGGTLSADPSFAVDLERERMLIENDVDDYKFYPVIQAALSYRF